MSSPIQKRTVYLQLQQAVLDCDDNAKLLDVLFGSAFANLPTSGFDYLFIGAFFNDNEFKIVKNCFIDARDVSPTNNPDFDSFIRTENILYRDGAVKSDLVANKIVVSGETNLFIDSSYDHFSNVKSVIISPLSVQGKLAGGLVLACPHTKEEVAEPELEIVEIFTNLVGFVHRLQDTQASLSTITQEVYKMNAKLHQLDKLKDDFVSVASHELRTPMSAIKSYLWMALHKHPEPLSDNMKRYLDRAYISVERLINLVNDMLNISRIEGGRIALNLSEVDLGELADEIVEEVNARADEKGVVVSVLKSAIPKVLCDRDKIHQVYLNLVGNALKFTPKGGKITVRFSLADDMVYVAVADTGSGIGKEDLSRLFKKFGRLDNSYVSVAESGGTGLGLFISKSLVVLHKGDIVATSEGAGRGAQFTFSLPIVGSKVAQKLIDEAPKETRDTKDLENTNINV